MTDIEIGGSIPERLARIEAKLDGGRDSDARLELRLDAQQSKIDRLERFMWLALGMALTANLSDLLKAATMAKVGG